MFWLETRRTRYLDRSQLIFVIGAPRSGTTLLYQLITEAFDVGYISNSHARFFGGISYVEKWKRPLQQRIPSDFQSFHGQTKGPTTPSECGKYWYQFFQRTPAYETMKQFSSRSSEQLRASLSRISNAFGKPVVFKNVMNSARLQVLSALFPEAVFVICVRELVDNSHSIIEAKQQALGRIDVWWSLEPKGFEAFESASPEIQAVQQVKLCQKMIREDISSHDSSKVLEIKYESLCDHPVETTDRLFGFLKQSFPQLSRRSGVQIPEKFSRKSGIRIDAKLYEKLKSTAKELTNA